MTRHPLPVALVPRRRSSFASVNVVSGLVFAACSALLLWISYLPHEQSLSDSLDSMYWPRLVLWGLLAVSLLLASEWLWLTNAGSSAEREPERARDDRWPLIAIGCCVAYLVLVGIAGFLLSTLLFCAAFPILLGLRDWRRVAAFALGVTGSIWLLVIVLMHVALPRGVGMFRAVSLFFY